MNFVEVLVLMTCAPELGPPKFVSNVPMDVKFANPPPPKMSNESKGEPNPKPNGLKNEVLKVLLG